MHIVIVMQLMHKIVSHFFSFWKSGHVTLVTDSIPKQVFIIVHISVRNSLLFFQSASLSGLRTHTQTV